VLAEWDERREGRRGLWSELNAYNHMRAHLYTCIVATYPHVSVLKSKLRLVGTGAMEMADLTSTKVG
jgi:hypothetical protein